MAGNIGSVSITVDADASAVPKQVEKATSGPMAKIGASMGKALSASLAAAIDPKKATAALQSGLTSSLSRLGSVGKSALSPLTAQLSNFARGFTDASAASSALTGRLGSLGGAARSALQPAIAGVQNYLSGFRSAQAATSSFTGVMGSIGGVARTAWNAVSTAASAVSPVVSKVMSGIVSAASSAWDALKSGASSAWASIKSGAVSAFSSIGTAMKGTLETAAKATGAGVAGVLGVALTKGFSRLEAIDTAEAKLAGLGITGDKLAATMQSATNAVKGTSFGLGEAASAAASFSAAGVPIDGMERSLRILASTAAVGGSSLSEMGTIFGKVAATGKVNGEVLQQLAERGVPALSLLAKEMGVTAAEASKMVSSGKVDFETFQAAMEAGLGPAAAAMGQSFSGMMANVGASLGRLGATAQRPIFEAIKSVLPGLINLFDQIAKVIEPVAVAIGERLAPAAERVGAVLSALDFSSAASSASSFLPALAPLLPVLGAFAGMLGPMLAQIPVLGSVFSGLTGPVGLVAGAFAALLAFDPQTLLNGFSSIQATLPGILAGMVDGLTTLLPAMVSRLAENVPIMVNGIGQIIRQIIPAIATALPGVITSAASLISEVIPAMLTALATQATLIGTSLMNALLGAIPALMLAIPQIVTAFATLIPQLLNSLLTAIPALLNGALQLFLAIAQAIPVVLPQIVAALLAMIPQLATSLITALPLIVEAALALFMGVIEGLVQAVPLIIAAVLELLPQLIESLASMLPTIIESALELFLGVVTGLLTAIPDILVALLGMLPQLIGTLLGMIPTLINGAVQLFTGLVQALPVIIPKLIDALVKLGPTMVQTLIGLVPQLLQAGVDLIGGLVSGLFQAAGSVGAALLQIAQDAVGNFMDFLGIHSPSRVFMAFGRNIIDGLAIGLKKSSKSAVTEMRSTAKQIAAAVDNKTISRATGNALTSALQTSTNRISATLTAREKVIARLKTAQKSLADIIADRDKYASTVSSNVVGLVDLTKSKTSGDMIAALQKQVANTAKFRTTIAELTKLGLDKASIEELTDNFAKTGSAASAEALLAGGSAAVKQVGALRNQLQAEGDKLGKTVGNSLYGAGVNAAQGLVNGLSSQAKALQTAANKIADSLVTTIKKRLGIKSPSRVLAGVGVDTMAGYVKGVTSMASAVDDAFSTVMPPELTQPVTVKGTSLQPGADYRAPVTTSNDSSRHVTVAEGAVQISGPDPRKIALETADAIAEEVSL